MESGVNPLAGITENVQKEKHNPVFICVDVSLDLGWCVDFYPKRSVTTQVLIHTYVTQLFPVS